MAKEDRGFASMDRNKQREIASKGGKAAHQKGTAHEWTSEEAREAGRKGGMASHRRKQQQQQSDGASSSEGNAGGEQMIGNEQMSRIARIPCSTSAMLDIVSRMNRSTPASRSAVACSRKNSRASSSPVGPYGSMRMPSGPMAPAT